MAARSPPSILLKIDVLDVFDIGSGLHAAWFDAAVATPLSSQIPEIRDGQDLGVPAGAGFRRLVCAGGGCSTLDCSGGATEPPKAGWACSVEIKILTTKQG